jgi:hypothetical protein
MYKKAAIFVLIIIFIGLVIFNRPSNLSESFSNWVSPANSPDNKKEVVVLPNLKGEIEVYYDVQTANIYIIDGPVVRVIPRTYSGNNDDLKSYDVSDSDKLAELKKLTASSITSSKNQWVYTDGTNYITYSPTGTNTKIIISKSENGIMKQATFDFTSLTVAIDLSNHEFTAVETSVSATSGSNFILSDSTGPGYDIISSDSTPGSDLILSDSTPGDEIGSSDSTPGDESTPGSVSVRRNRSRLVDKPITVGLFGNVYRTIKSIKPDRKAEWLGKKIAPVTNVKKIKNANKNDHYVGEEVYILFESDTNAKGDNTYAAGNISVDNGDGTYNITYKSRKAKNPVSKKDLNVVV